MPSFFIDRPIFAWVVALLICLGGILSIPFLPVAQYPMIAPPSISISTSYPGASPENLYNSVTRLIEEELNGANGILNFESTSDSLGQVEIVANFVPGTNTESASVEVQNRIKRVEARLPRAVIQQGILIEEASSAVLQIITLRSTDGSLDEVGLGDFMVRNILGEVRRIPGVGRATLYSTERSLRIWIDPRKLVSFNLTADDVTRAIASQNAQVASGSIGVEPSNASQQVSALVLVKGQFESPTEFGSILLRANDDGSTVRLRDVARIEVGGLSYQFTTRQNGQPSAGLSVLLAPTGNALATATAVRAKMVELSNYFPANIKYDIPYDITPVVEASIAKVLMTLLEAVALVFVVMLLFLQNIRYTIIPTLVVPIALLGACAVLLMMGLSINMLTMFGMVLAIGILVDDAIVVVENVERIMAEEGLPPREATRKAMSQITGAIVGITLVLVSVFIPMAFFPGSVGIIYRQFSITMVAAIAISALLALSLTPALCATILKPVGPGHHAKGGVFGWFNRKLDATKGRYAGIVAWSVKRAGRLMLIYLALVVGVAWGFMRLPAGFLPIDDQGFITTDVQTPPEASFNRTLEAVKAVEQYLLQRSGIENVTFLTGYSFLGQGQNTAQAFITLKDWSERGASDSAEHIVADINTRLVSINDATVSALQPPPIDNLGNSSGFSFRLQDRGQRGYAELMKARDQLLAAAHHSPVLQDVYVEGLPPAPQVRLEIDREKAAALGVTFEEINNTISTNLGSSYINDFPNRGRMQRVVVQADRGARMQADEILALSRAQHPGPARADVVVRDRAMGLRPDPDRGLQLLSVGAHRGFRQARLHQRRRDPRDGAARRPAAARLRLRVDRPVAAGKACRLAGAAPARTVGAAGVPGARGALRKLDDSARRTAHCAARHARRGRSDRAARPAERRLFHRRPRHHHRARGQGRHPDRGVCARPLPAGPAAARGHDRGLPYALPPDPDDGACLHLRCRADGDRVGCGRQEPAGAWHHGDGRHDQRRGAGVTPGAGVLRVRAGPVRPQRAATRHGD